MGILAATLAVLFTLRVVWEQTFLAWTRGAMSYQSPLRFGMDLVGLFCSILAFLWALGILARSLGRPSRVSSTDRRLIAAILLSCGLWHVPYETWKLLMARALGAEHTPHSWILAVAGSGENGLLAYLVTHGVDPNTRSESGQSALAEAALNGQLQAARLLIAHGARLDTRTRVTFETPLSEAAQTDQTAMVKLLLEHGADPAAMDVAGLTALDWAQRNGNRPMAELLRRAGRSANFHIDSN